MPHIAIDRAKFYGQDKIVIDTNILIFIYGGNYEPGGKPPRRAKPYTTAYRDILTAKAEILLLDVVIGEFYKVLEQMACNDWFETGAGRNLSTGSRRENLKNFRRLGPHTTFVKYFDSAIQDLLTRYSHGRLARTKLEPRTLADLTAENQIHKVDYNDYLIARFAIENGAQLLTADADLLAFTDDLDIIHEARKE